MGFEGYVRRLEITINDGLENSLDDGEPATNLGRHHHFHVILFVSKDSFNTVFDMEVKLKNDWVDIVSEQFKNSKIPFDLLREVTAANIDLWCEYAIATKGLSALHFSRPLLKKINACFEAHPDNVAL